MSEDIKASQKDTQKRTSKKKPKKGEKEDASPSSLSLSRKERIEIGKIVRGESHFLYWVLVRTEDEQRGILKPEDSSYGTFVYIPRSHPFSSHKRGKGKKQKGSHSCLEEKGHFLVGVIADTMLLDKDVLRLGPRLANQLEMINIVYPDFIDERIKIVKIIIIGEVKDGLPRHHFPRVSPNLGDFVYKMNEEDVRYFHFINNSFQIGYYSFVLDSSVYLMRNILEEFKTIFDENHDMIDLLINNLEYSLKMKGGI